jgi:hypothetical protein
LMQRQAAPPEARSEQTSSGTSKALRSRSGRRQENHLFKVASNRSAPRTCRFSALKSHRPAV